MLILLLWKSAQNIQRSTVVDDVFYQRPQSMFFKRGFNWASYGKIGSKSKWKLNLLYKGTFMKYVDVFLTTLC